MIQESILTSTMKTSNELRKWNNEMYIRYKPNTQSGIIGRVQDARRQLMLKLANIKKEDAVLEFGCEDGNFSSMIPSCKTLVSFDISDTALRDAKKSRANASFVLTDATGNLPFKKSRFDVVIAGEILEHVEKPEQIIENIYNTLKPGGRAVVSIPNEKFYSRIKKVIKNTVVLRPLFSRQLLELSDWHMHHDFCRKKAEMLLRQRFDIIGGRSVMNLHHVFLVRKRIHPVQDKSD